MVIAVAGVAGTLGGALLTQRGAERTKRREIELVRARDEKRENQALRRTCYADLNRDARQFTTALNRHLHTLRATRGRGRRPGRARRGEGRLP